ncbi:hypothetical protein R6Q59_019963 [Mikania micrantha]
MSSSTSTRSVTRIPPRLDFTQMHDGSKSFDLQAKHFAQLNLRRHEQIFNVNYIESLSAPKKGGKPVAMKKKTVGS